MPQFHETGYGQRFFNGQLPALTRALERLAAALEERNALDKQAHQCGECGGTNVFDGPCICPPGSSCPKCIEKKARAHYLGR